MPVFLAALLGGLVQAAGSIVGRVLIALGVGFVSITGVSTTINYLLSLVQTHVNSSSAFAIAALGLLQFDVVVGIFVGAVTARLLLNGLTGGAIKRMIWK